MQKLRTGLRAASAATITSVIVHALVTWLLPSHAPEQAPFDVVELEMDVVQPVAPVEPDVVIGRAGAATTPRAVTPVQRQAGLRVRRSANDVVLPPPAPTTVDVADVAPPPAACAVPQPLHIDPLSAAVAGIEDGNGDGSPSAALSNAFSSSLAAEANHRSWSTHRAPPELRRTSDGGYEYRGPRFAAHIDRDGAVRFADADAVSLNGPDGSGAILGGHFDIGEAAMRASGQDPLTPERAWFMRETEELRARLDAQARHADGEASLRELERRLAAIVGSTRLSAAQQRARVFDTWDDCETDAIGDRARATIAAFARSHFPEGTPLAYTAPELAALNARRVTRERFDPYRG